MKKIIFVGLLFALVFSGCSWFKRNENTPTPPPTSITPSGQPDMIPTIKPERTTRDIVAYCTTAPTTLENGREMYPIEPTYQKVQFLGQLFTAALCGPEGANPRLEKIFGVSADTYTLGSSLYLNDKPSSGLLSTFKKIGFSCKQGIDESTCKEWQLSKDVKVNALLELELYAKEFASDDCIQCG